MSLVLDVEHQTVGVVRGFGMPVLGRVQDLEAHAGLGPGERGRDSSNGNAAGSDLAKQELCFGILVVLESGGDHDLADTEPVEQVRETVVMILVGMAEVDRVQPAESQTPEHRGDDPAPTRGSPMRPQS